MAKRKVVSQTSNLAESQGIIKVDLSSDSLKKLSVIQKDLKCDESQAIDILIKFVKPAELKNNIQLAKEQKELSDIQNQIDALESQKRDILNHKKTVSGRAIVK